MSFPTAFPAGAQCIIQAVPLEHSVSHCSPVQPLQSAACQGCRGPSASSSSSSSSMGEGVEDGDDVAETGQPEGGLAVLVQAHQPAWKGTFHLEIVPCGLWLFSCLLHVVSWSHRQTYSALSLREQGQVFAGGVLLLAPTFCSAAAEVISPLRQPMWWWWVQELLSSRAGKWGSAVADCRFVACFLIVFWLFSVPFLLTLIFSKMKYPVSNCSQIVIIDCGQMAHSLWSSNDMRETAALSCVYKYWC